MIDQSMIPGFIHEIQEYLDRFASGLHRPEGTELARENINAACRAVRAIWNNARHAGVDQTAELSQRLGNLLDPVRQGKKSLDPELLDILITGKDRLAELVNNLRTFGVEKADIGSILARIDAYENQYGRTQASPPAEESKPEQAPAEEPGAHEIKDETESEFTDDLSDLFADFEEEEDAFPDDAEMLAALAGEEDGAADDEKGSPAPGPARPEIKHHKEKASPEDEASAPAAETEPVKVTLPAKAKVHRIQTDLDISSLREEIEKEATDEELLHIFIKQTRDNIALLRTLTDNFNDTEDQAHILYECSDLISRLHSSANYMGYDRLTEFYGQWIAELEMAGMELSSGSQASFAFMEKNIRMIVKLFPQIEDIPAEDAVGGTDLPQPEPTSSSFPSPEEGEARKETEKIQEDDSEEDLFSNLFINLDDSDEDNFADDDELIAALAEEETQEVQDIEPVQPTAGEETQQELEQELEHFFVDESDPSILSAEKERGTEKTGSRTLRSGRPMIDTDSLKREIEEEEYDEELFQIFIQQLQENISLLRALADSFPGAAGKVSMIKKCSDLLTALHSSANYMGYERLTEFYGQWIAELEMADLQLSIGVPVSLDFMDEHIKTVTEIFPRIEDRPANLELDRQFQPTGAADAGLAEESDGEVVGGTGEATDVDGEDIAWPDDEDASVSEETSSPESDAQPETVARRTELFARLSGALESLSSLTTEKQEPDEEPLQDFPGPGLAAHDMEESELFDKLSSALDADLEIQTTADSGIEPAPDADQQLYDRLNTALEEREINGSEAGTKSIDDVLAEILTGYGLAETGRSKQPEQSRPEPDDLASRQAMGRSVGADRRLILSDRRRGPEDRRLTDPLKPGKLRGSIRVDTEKIDNLMRQVEELIISRSNISQLYREMGDMQKYLHDTARLTPGDLRPLRDYADRLNQANTSLGRVSSEIQEGVLNVRMLPAAYLFNRYPRFIKEMVRHTDKKVKFTIRGEETELDKMILEEISGPLVHILRNCVEHGIETAEERKQAGKEETANLQIAAYPESNTVVIEIRDDGRGIDPQKVKQAAMERNLLPPEKVEDMSDKELIMLIMAPGFSPASQSADPPGPGGSMDEVHEDIENLNGTIDIRSQAGAGTRFRITIPLAVSVLKTLAVRVGGKIITVPLANIVELTRARPEDITEEDGIKRLRHRDASLPVFRLSEILNISREASDTPHLNLLVVKARDQRTGLIVDEFMRPTESVVKPLVEYLKKESGFSGATIREDGTISLVLDTAALLAIIKSRMTDMQQKDALENFLKGLAPA